jgi:hypothetical protein
MLTKINTQVLPLTAVLLMSAAPVAVLSGCDDNHLLGRFPPGDSPGDAGSGGQGASGDAAIAIDSSHPDISVREVGMLGPSSSWTGYIENKTFPSGSDVLKITFASDPAGLVVGRVTLGMGTPPPPATDPEAAYPPGVDPRDDTRAGYLAEGFPFSMNGGTLVGNRLRFTMAQTEVWAGWCALQTPVDDSGGCLPNWPSSADPVRHVCSLTNPQTGQVVTVNCNKFFMCGPLGGICSCAAGTCAVNLSPEISFDMMVSGDQVSGSVTGRLGDRNVHFARDR